MHRVNVDARTVARAVPCCTGQPGAGTRHIAGRSATLARMPRMPTAVSAPATRIEAGNASLTGIALMAAATLVFALQDTVTKELTASLPIGQIVWVRFTAFLLFALAFAYRGDGIGVACRSVRPGRQLLRCLLMCSEIALFAFALRFLGLAEIHALFSCFPLIVAALSVPMLGERVGWRRWLAVIVGLIGTLLILRPGSGVFDPYALLALACALIYALYNLLTRLVSRHDRFSTSLVYFGAVGTLASLPFAWLHWQAPNGRQTLLLGALCLSSIGAHLMLIKALEITEAVVLQPFHYLVLLWAILIGVFAYGETLAATTLAGAAIVVGSGVYVAWREYRTATAPTPAAERSP